MGYQLSGAHSWKTTALGYAVAILNVIANGRGWKEIMMSVAIALLGHYAKDKDVTGGTRQKSD